MLTQRIDKYLDGIGAAKRRRCTREATAASADRAGSACIPGAGRDMLIIVRGTAPANRISLHPAAGWLSTFLDAGVDLLGYDGMPCSQAAGPLAEAVRRIQASPDDYKILSPAGREIRVIDVLRWAADMCARFPTATMTIRVRNA